MIPAIQEVNFPPYATLHQATVSLQDMGDRVISTQVRIDGDVVPDFSGWELKFKGERFVLPSDNPQASKDNTTRNSIVDLQFQSWVIQELKRYYFFEAASVSAGVAIADKYVTPVRLNVEDFVAMLNQVLKYYFGDTVVADLYMSGQGQYSTEPKVIDINYSYLWDVIGQIYEIYGVRYRIVYNSTTGVYTIKFGWPTTDIDITDHDFEYGYKGGLLKFERQVQDETITNILLGRGGEKNLPYRYFKLKEENAGTTWEGDPDAIPELKNIYFDRLRDINFRWYVRGWMHNPNRDTSGDEAWDPGHVFPTYEISSDSPYYWAYQKGLTDTQFNPVEFVKDDASIEAYGERWGAADDNDEIYPTIQGRSRNPIGRIDEVVAVSPIVTDDIDAMAAASSVEKSIDRMVVTSPSSNPYTIDSDWFEIPTGQTGNIRYAWVGPTEGSSVTHIATDQSSIVAIDANGTEHPISGLSAGRYKLHLSLKLHVPDGYTTAGQWGLENIVLTTSAQDANAWKPTFDIWVKNIWGTQFRDSSHPSESPEQYAARVWEEILGDRAGNEAKVVFSTGFMSVSEDYEFVIASYPVYDTSKNINGVPSEWRITLRKSDAEYEATGLYIPNATTGGKPVAGDKFFFTGIDMPFLYVTLGEEDLNTNKSSQLEGLSVVNPTWVISLDKVRVHTLEDGEYGQTLADRLAAGAKLRITDPRFSGGDILTLYAQSITYTWNEPSENSPYIVPDIEVVLSDKVVSRQSRADKMESSIQEIRSNYARLDDVERVVRSVAEPMFLKKTGEADSSDSPTQFSSKVSSKGFRQGGVGGNGWGFYRDNTKEVAEGEEGEGDSVLEIDRIVVRKELEVNSLVVNQAEYRGGREIQSAAQIECTKVVVDDSGKYVCYFDQKQGSVKNLFVVGDFAYSTEFAPDNTVVKYYRRRVDAVDVDRIVLSDTVKDGAGVPAAGDVIIQYGHESNTARQYIIVRDVIGGGYERMISGLSTVSTNGKEYYFAGRQTRQYYDKPRWFVGDSDGEYAEYLNGILNIKGRLTVLNNHGAYVSMDAYMNSVAQQFASQQAQIDGQTQSWASGEASTPQTKPYPLWDEETQAIIGTPNYPYTNWANDTEREKHVGDIYMDDSTGQGYRLTKLVENGTTRYYWIRITDEEVALALSLAQQAVAGVSGLQYLANALNASTLVQGGLILTSLIQLGQTENNVFKVYSGINGTFDQTLTDPTKSIAAWYGGEMLEKATWDAMSSADKLLHQYAKTIFRMDGSGYLAGGNIHWDENGYGGIPGINWGQASGGGVDVTIGANVKLAQTGGDGTTVTDLISVAQQITRWFDEYTIGGRKYLRLKIEENGIRGLVTDGEISSGGLSGGTPTGGNLDPDLMFQYLANAPELSDHTHDEDQIAIEHLTTALSSYVPKTRTVNGKALSADVTLTLDDVNDGSSRKLSDYLVAADIAPLSDAIGNLSSGLTGVEGDLEQLREMSATRAWVSNALADSFVKIGSTRVGLGETALALAGLMSVEATKFYFDANTYFELDANGNVRLVAPTGKFFYTDLSFSSGGISGGTPSGGGLDPVLMFQYLANDPELSDHAHDEDQIHPLHLSTALAGYVNDLTISGSGNYVASLTKSGKILTATMGTIGDAAFRGIATAIGSSVTGLVDGALLYGILGDAFDAANTVKGFVNSSIATATATFRGTNTTATTEAAFLTWANALTHNLNDYVFWKTTDSDGNVVFKRYKYGYDGTEAGSLAWRYEYDLNNSSFTAAQWAAISSGITSTKVGTYDTVAGYFENSKIKSANLPAMYVGYSQIAFSQAKTTLLGVNGFTNATIASAENDNTKVVWDSTYSAWRFYGNVIVEGQLSSGGVSGGTPSGGGLDATLMFQYLANDPELSDHTHDTDQIAAEHLTDVLGDYLKMTTTRAANQVLAGPASGSDAAPTFRSLVAADIPAISHSKISDWSTATASFVTAANTDPLADAIGNLATGLTGMAADLESMNEIMATKNWVSNRFLTENQDITLSGDVSGRGKTSINVTIGAEKVTNEMLAGSIANNKLANSKVTIGTTDVSLGASTLVLAGLTSVTATKFYFNANTYFELDSSGNVRLVAPTGKYFYTDVSFSSGGLSSGTPGGGGATSLAALDDVSLVGTPTDGQILAVGANGFWTNIAKDYYTKSQTYTQAEVNALIGAINQFHYEIYASTSVVTNPQSNVLYLIGPTGSGSDKYEEYVYSNSTWTKIGDTSIDLSGYMLSSSFTAQNIASTLGNTAVNRATGDGDGNTISSTYLKKSGGTMSGDITMPSEVCLIKNVTFDSTSGWARDIARIAVDGNRKFAIAAYGVYTLGASNNGITYAYLGCNAYNGLNLRISASDISWGTDAILHAGNYSSYALPLSGGTLTGNLTLKYAQLRFQNSSGTDIGYLSVDAHDNPIWLNCSDNAWYNILHSNNYSSYALPLAGGTMTGLLKIATGSGIEDATGNGMLCYHPSSWTGVSSSQWGVGAVDCQGVIRSSNSNLIHSRAGSDSTIYDSGNSNNSSTAWTCSYLTVNASAQTSYRAYVNGVIASTGDQIITSDETKKMNFENIRLSVRDIASVRAVTYDLKADGSHSFGTIAQDWLGILPEAVLGEEGDYSFAYAQAAMVSSIINSREIVKIEKHETEQDKEIRKLRKRVSDLEKEIERLRAN